MEEVPERQAPVNSLLNNKADTGKDRIDLKTKFEQHGIQQKGAAAEQEKKQQANTWTLGATATPQEEF